MSRSRKGPRSVPLLRPPQVRSAGLRLPLKLPQAGTQWQSGGSGPGCAPSPLPQRGPPRPPGSDPTRRAGDSESDSGPPARRRRGAAPASWGAGGPAPSSESSRKAPVPGFKVPAQAPPAGPGHWHWQRPRPLNWHVLRRGRGSSAGLPPQRRHAPRNRGPPFAHWQAVRSAKKNGRIPRL